MVGLLWVLVACGARTGGDVAGDDCVGERDVRWTRELVSDVVTAKSGAGGAYPIFAPSMAMEEDGASVAYAGEDGALSYARRRDGVWETEEVGVVTTSSPAIATGPDGEPWIAYRSDVGNVEVVKAPGWGSSVVAPAGEGRVDLVVTPAGIAHVCCTGPGEASIEHRTNATGEWSGDALATWTPYDEVGWCDLAVDLAGGVHAVFVAQFGGSLEYGRLVDDAWMLEEIRGDEWPSLAVDAEGAIHVFYDSLGTQALTHAIRAPGGEWTAREAEVSDGYWLAPSVAADPRGFVQEAHPAADLHWSKWSGETLVDSGRAGDPSDGTGSVSLGIGREGEPCLLSGSIAGVYYTCREVDEPDCDGSDR